MLAVTLWRAWRAVACGIGNRSRRETFLSFYALLTIILMYTVWAFGLVFAFALLHWSTGSHLAGIIGTAGGIGAVGFGSDLYMSGTTFFTLGLGDLHQIGRAS